jgi:hypothetical protein
MSPPPGAVFIRATAPDERTAMPQKIVPNLWRARRAMEAMFGMRKIEIAALRSAADGVANGNRSAGAGASRAQIG